MRDERDAFRYANMVKAGVLQFNASVRLGRKVTLRQTGRSHPPPQKKADLLELLQHHNYLCCLQNGPFGTY